MKNILYKTLFLIFNCLANSFVYTAILAVFFNIIRCFLLHLPPHNLHPLIAQHFSPIALITRARNPIHASPCWNHSRWNTLMLTFTLTEQFRKNDQNNKERGAPAHTFKQKERGERANQRNRRISRRRRWRRYRIFQGRQRALSGEGALNLTIFRAFLQRRDASSALPSRKVFR